MNQAETKLGAAVIIAILLFGTLAFLLTRDESISYTIIDFDYQRAYHDLEYLAGELDNRLSGTDNELNAAQYIADEFNASGLTNILIHEFEWTLYEPRGNPSLEATYEKDVLFQGSPVRTVERRETIDHLSEFVILGFSGTLTGNDGDDIEVAYVGNGDEENYTIAGDVSGKAVLVENPGGLSYSELYLAALQHGAAVSLLFDTTRDVPIAKTSVGIDDNGHYIPFPEAYPEYADNLIPHLMLDNASGYMLKDWVAQAAQNDDEYVEVNLNIQVTVEQRPVRVVTADVQGASDELILLGAHMDTHYLGPGAVDNGVGTVTVMEVARQLANVSGLKRTIRFATWGGEEIGLLGSYGYFKQYRALLDDHLRMYLNFDMSHASLEEGADRIPMEINSLRHMEPLQELTGQFFDQEPALASTYQVTFTYRESAGPSDHRTFNLEGFDSMTSYGSGSKGYHTPHDNLQDETINPESLQIAGRIEGSYALYLASK